MRLLRTPNDTRQPLLIAIAIDIAGIIAVTSLKNFLDFSSYHIPTTCPSADTLNVGRTRTIPSVGRHHLVFLDSDGMLRAPRLHCFEGLRWCDDGKTPVIMLADDQHVALGGVD